MVPKGWERKPIKEFCESIIDCVNKTATTVDFVTPYKMLRTTNVRNGRVNTVDVKYVTEDVYLEWTRRGKPQKGDLIFTREAPVGEVGVLEDQDGVFLGQRTMMYRANLEKANNYYLFYSLQSRFCQKQIEDFSNGGTVEHMRVPDCGEIIINVPPISEQNKIAKILSVWDKAITTTEQLLANSQQQKKALMQKLLTGKVRLLDENGIRFGENWKIISINRMGKVVSGGTPDTNTKEFWDGDISWLTPTDVTALKTRFVYNTNRTISELGVKNSSATILPKGSLMVCTRATIGVLAISTGEICTNQGFKNVIPSNNFDVDFLYYLLSHHSKEMLRKACGSTFLELSKKDFERLEFISPTLEEQKKIVKVLSATDQEIAATQKKLDALKQEKKALMQQLLTGKRRVSLN